MVVTPVTELVLTRSHYPCSKHTQSVQQAVGPRDAPNFIPLMGLLKSRLMLVTLMRCSESDGNFPLVLETPQF